MMSEQEWARIRQMDLHEMVEQLQTAYAVFATIAQADTLDEARALALAQVGELRNWRDAERE